MQEEVKTLHRDVEGKVKELKTQSTQSAVDQMDAIQQQLQEMHGPSKEVVQVKMKVDHHSSEIAHAMSKADGNSGAIEQVKRREELILIPVNRGSTRSRWVQCSINYKRYSMSKPK